MQWCFCRLESWLYHIERLKSRRDYHSKAAFSVNMMEPNEANTMRIIKLIISILKTMSDMNKYLDGGSDHKECFSWDSTNWLKSLVIITIEYWSMTLIGDSTNLFSSTYSLSEQHFFDSRTRPLPSSTILSSQQKLFGPDMQSSVTNLSSLNVSQMPISEALGADSAIWQIECMLHSDTTSATKGELAFIDSLGHLLSRMS